MTPVGDGLIGVRVVVSSRFVGDRPSSFFTLSDTAMPQHRCLPLVDDVRPSRVSVSLSHPFSIFSCVGGIIHCSHFSGQRLSWLEAWPTLQHRSGLPAGLARFGFNVLTHRHPERSIVGGIKNKKNIIPEPSRDSSIISSVYFRLRLHLMTLFARLETVVKPTGQPSSLFFYYLIVISTWASFTSGTLATGW